MYVVDVATVSSVMPTAQQGMVAPSIDTMFAALLQQATESAQNAGQGVASPAITSAQTGISASMMALVPNPAAAAVSPNILVANSNSAVLPVTSLSPDLSPSADGSVAAAGPTAGPAQPDIAALLARETETPTAVNGTDRPKAGLVMATAPSGVASVPETNTTLNDAPSPKTATTSDVTRGLRDKASGNAAAASSYAALFTASWMAPTPAPQQPTGQTAASGSTNFAADSVPSTTTATAGATDFAANIAPLVKTAAIADNTDVAANSAPSTATTAAAVANSTLATNSAPITMGSTANSAPTTASAAATKTTGTAPARPQQNSANLTPNPVPLASSQVNAQNTAPSAPVQAEAANHEPHISKVASPKTQTTPTRATTTQSAISQQILPDQATTDQTASDSVASDQAPQTANDDGATPTTETASAKAANIAVTPPTDLSAAQVTLVAVPLPAQPTVKSPAVSDDNAAAARTVAQTSTSATIQAGAQAAAQTATGDHAPASSGKSDLKKNASAAPKAHSASDKPSESALAATPMSEDQTATSQPVTAQPVAANDAKPVLADIARAAPTNPEKPAADTNTVVPPTTPLAAATPGTLAAKIEVTSQKNDSDIATPFDKLGLTIAARTAEGLHHFDIRLDPAELGKVQVRLTVDDNGQAQATLVADKQQTLDLLQRDSSSLNRALQDAGLNLSNNGLNFSLREQYQQNEAGGQARRRSLSAAALLATDAPQSRSSQGSYAPNSVRLDIRV